MGGIAWRVTIRTPDRVYVREAFAQNEGGAAAVALGSLVTRTEALREHGPGLERFEVEVERAAVLRPLKGRDGERPALRVARPQAGRKAA